MRKPEDDEPQPSGLYYKMLEVGEKIVYMQRLDEYRHGPTKYRRRIIEATEVVPIWDGKCAYRGEYTD